MKPASDLLKKMGPAKVKNDINVWLKGVFKTKYEWENL